MNWPLFTSTFFLIFFAELGDKTQLAVMGKSATADSRWTIFIAGALALTLSTAIGVVAGAILEKYISPRILKFAGAGLFIIFGLLMLREALQKPPAVAEPTPVPQAALAPGVLGRFLLAQAAEFERSALADYNELAGRAESPHVKQLLERLALDEKNHLDQLTDLSLHHPEADALAAPATGEIFTEDALRFDLTAADRPPLEHAIEHELATAAFYSAFAKAAAIPDVRAVLTALAQAEQRHAQQLRQLLDHG